MTVNKCDNCYIEAEWQNRYIMASQRFDKALQKALAATMIAVIVSLICIIITAFMAMKTIKFINSFEYVEETTYQIEQDEGVNVATIGGESNEVNIYGTENN